MSNFQEARFFDFAHYVDTKPMVNQLQCNAMIQQRGIEPTLNEYGTKMMAWGPLGGQGVDGIIKSELLGGIGAIPKSSHKERMAQNFDIFDFSLTDDEMAQITTMNQHDTGVINFNDMQFVKHLIETYG